MNRTVVFSIMVFFLSVACSVFTVPIAVFATDGGIIEVLERDGCVHCEEEKRFLIEEVARHDDLSLRFIDIGTPEGRDLFDRVTASEGLPRATPITAVGGTVIQGFDSAETTGRVIMEAFDRGIAESRPGGFEAILTSDDRSAGPDAGAVCDDGTVCGMPVRDALYVSLPFFGTVDMSPYSLPVMSVVLGFVDGFNPCALWVLVTFLLVLIQIGDRGKMFLVAGLFVLAETVMYYLILNVWFSAWDFIGLDRIMTPLIGTVAVGGGLFFLFEWKKGDGTCQVTDVRKRAKISGRIRTLVSEPFTWVTAAGIVALAVSVNVIEFACSIGIPQAFTKILELNSLGFLGTQGLMLLYILAYMVDDFLVFGLALWGAGKLQSVHGYARWCNLFGGVLMILLGFLLVFRPERLLF